MSDSAVTTAENTTERAPDNAPRSPPHVPDRLIHFVLRATLILALLHAYIGWRLLPDLLGGTGVFTTGVGVLALSTLLSPWGMLARFVIARQPLSDYVTWAGVLAMGYFSSVLVLTALRDIFLLLARVAHWITANPDPLALAPLLQPTAIGVPALFSLWL